jgi:DNA-binding GntR family transcriptional regulator
MRKSFAGMQPIEKAGTLASKVGSQLRTAIMAGNFKPGEQLTLRSVADALLVSMTPAREALFTLCSEGILDTSQSGTIFVPTLTYERVRELSEIRRLLEGLLAKEAASKLSDAAIEGLVDIHKRLTAADVQRDFRQVISLNWEFHFGIYEAAAMPTALKMVESCWLKASSYYSNVYPEIAKSGRGLINHNIIVAALQRRSAYDLASAVQTDVEYGSQVLLEVMRLEANSRHDSEL